MKQPCAVRAEDVGGPSHRDGRSGPGTPESLSTTSSSSLRSKSPERSYYGGKFKVEIRRGRGGQSTAVCCPPPVSPVPTSTVPRYPRYLRYRRYRRYLRYTPTVPRLRQHDKDARIDASLTNQLVVCVWRIVGRRLDRSNTTIGTAVTDGPAPAPIAVL